MLSEPFVVTSLSVAQGRPGRLRVALNGQDVGDLTLDYVGDHGIRTGRSLTRFEAEGVVASAARTPVLDKALDLLAARARSSRDLRIRLRRAGAEPGAIDWAIDRLTAQGYVDDHAYARQVAQARALAGGVSKRKVVAELRRRGVSAEVAADAVASALREVDLDEEGAARDAARKRLRALGSVDPARRRQRLYAWLARRGYDSQVVRRVLAEVLPGDSHRNRAGA